jgi:adenosylcobinamide-GDP ribazoletransferase
MTTGDRLQILGRDALSALSLLTRLPLNLKAPSGAAAAWAWPLAGAVIGAIAGIIATVAQTAGLPPGLAAALALVTQALLTGAMHEDGLADCADGFWGGWTPARRLEIMKDSQIGTYGTLALILVTLIRWSAVATLLASGAGPLFLVAMGTLSRAPMALIAALLPGARTTGLSAAVGRPSLTTAVAGAALAAALALPGLGLAILPVALAIALISATLALTARTKIGGQTGDVLGASQQLAEAAALITATALL